MKKVGNFFLMFVPMLLVLSFQFFAMFFCMCITMLFLFASGQSFMGALESMLEIMLAPDFTLGMSVVFSLLSIASCGIWYHYSCGGKLLPPPTKEFNFKQFAGVFFIVPGAQFASNLIVTVISIIFPAWLEAYEQLIETAGLNDVSVLMILYSVILAPIGEELTFRGVTLRIGRKALPFWAANLIQAFLFGLFHMNMIQGCYAFVIGLVLGYVCEKGGSIYYAIFLHFLFNLWGTVIAGLLEGVTHPVAVILFYVAVIVSTIIGLLLFMKGMKQKEAKRLSKIQLENVNA